MIKKIMFLFVSFFCLLMSGCASKYDVKLPDSFEYDENEIDACQYIEKIDDTTIRDFNRSSNKIEQGEYHVACPTSKITKLGKQEVTVSINNVDIVLNFKIVDTTPPAIAIEKDNITVEENNEFFDLKKLITIKDRYDPNPIVGFTGDYDLAVPGNYMVEVSAKDSNGNKSKKEVSVAVAQKEVKVIEKEIIVNGNNNGSTNGSSGGSANIPEAPAQRPAPQPSETLSSLSSKSFLCVPRMAYI